MRSASTMEKKALSDVREKGEMRERSGSNGAIEEL